MRYLPATAAALAVGAAVCIAIVIAKNADYLYGLFFLGLTFFMLPENEVPECTCTCSCHDDTEDEGLES